MSTFDLLADLPLEVDGYALEGLRAQVSSGFERLTTVVHLQGGGLEGVGEDVVYDGEDQVALQEAGPVLELARALRTRRVLRADRLARPVPGRRPSRMSRGCTGAGRSTAPRSTWRCARPAGRCTRCSGASAGRCTFVVSLRLGEPPTLDPLTAPAGALSHASLQARPDQLVDARADRGAGRAPAPSTRSTSRACTAGPCVDQPPDPVLYRRVVEAFPDAWIEDPDVVTPETAAVLADAHDRITWDAPIHSIADIESLPFPPRMVNIKPSRIGGLPKLCAAYDYCAEHGIGAYGGGQFELGPGRGQAQYLASLFHPDTPNDLAPVGYNEHDPPPGLPARWRRRRPRPASAGGTHDDGPVGAVASQPAAGGAVQRTASGRSASLCARRSRVAACASR